MAIAKVVYKENASATPEVWMDTTQKTVTAGTMLSGTTALKNDGTGITGNIASKSSSDLTASGATVTAPAGYYPSSASKSVASGSATTPSTSITANPTISVDVTGLITASVSGSKSVTPTVSAGYVSSGTAGTVSVSGSNTEQLSTQSGTTITPTESVQTAVTSGKFTTGAVKVGAISSTYVGSGITQRDSTNLTASGATVTAPAGYYAEAASKSVASGSAGTPTATKGTVSNHSISVTPSVTNTTGYITGGTLTGTAVTVSASELVSGTKSITSSGTTDVTNYASASVAEGSATTPATSITANPTISVSSGGLITASVSGSKSVTPTVSAGLVSSGTAGTVSVSGSNTEQLTTQAATTYHPSTTDQTIASGKYLTGAQTVKGVLLTNLSAGNIKKDVVVKVGDSTDDDCVTSVTGTYEGGSGSSYSLLHSEEIEVSTTSTSATTEKIITLPVADYNSKMFFITVTDKAGPRSGYFYKSVIIWDSTSAGDTANSYRLGSQVIWCNSSGKVEATSTSQYGVWCYIYIFNGDSTQFYVKSRYNSSYSGTIDGTYLVEIYGLSWPDNESPFA